MRKTMMIGLMLLTMFSCQFPVIKAPVEMHVINTRTKNALSGFKDLNYKSNPSDVGEWLGETKKGKLDQLNPNLTCFSTEDWLKIIKPKMKEGSRYYHDQE